MSRFTRAFTGRSKVPRDPRLPPGQYDVGEDWPVLTAEVTPKLDLASWTFRVEGLVAQSVTWSWEQIHALEPSAFDGDIHCVTTWSKLAVSFSGVSVDTLLKAAQPLPAATHVLAFSHSGYTTNLPLGGRDGGPCLGRMGLRGPAACDGPRWPGPPPRTSLVLLEERQMGRGPPRSGPRRAGVLGA